MRSEPASGGETAPGSSPFALLFKTSVSSQSQPRPAKGSQSQPEVRKEEREKGRKGRKGEKEKERKGVK